jgi:hypothetical protein
MLWMACEVWLMKAVLVTGSRDHGNMRWFRGIFSSLQDRFAKDQHTQVVLIHGAGPGRGDALGTDRIAEILAGWMERPKWQVLSFPPHPDEVKQLGFGEAYLQRNQRMVDQLSLLQSASYDPEAHAFPLPGSKGTWHTKRLAEAAGFKVEVHRP